MPNINNAVGFELVGKEKGELCNKELEKFV